MRTSLASLEELFELGNHSSAETFMPYLSEEQKNEPRFSAINICTRNPGSISSDIDTIGLGLICKDPDEPTWSIQDLYNHNADWAMDIIEDVLGFDSLADETKVEVSPDFVALIRAAEDMSRDQMVRSVLYPLDDTGALELATHLEIPTRIICHGKCNQCGTTRPDETLPPDDAFILEKLNKLSEEKFNQAISEIMIVVLKQEGYIPK